jgi:hypothetical protein
VRHSETSQAGNVPLAKERSARADEIARTYPLITAAAANAVKLR